MNATLETKTGHHNRPPQPVVEHDNRGHDTWAAKTPHEHPVRRVNLIDRVALHVGIALIKWGRRPRPAESRERRANRYEQRLAREQRERASEQMMRLLTPLR